MSSETIHELSSAVPLPEFDLFTVPGTQTAVDGDIWSEHRPINIVDPGSFAQFEITTGIDEYLHLDKFKIALKCKPKVKLDDITKSVDWASIGVCNNLLHSMIKQVDVFIGGNQITSATSTYAYRAYIETFLGYGRDAKASHLTSAMWFNDEEIKKVDDIVTKTTKYLKADKEIELIGPIHLDTAFSNRVLPGGVKITVRVSFNEPKFYFISKKHTPEMEILEIALHTHRAKVAPAIVEAHNLALKVAPAKYPLTHGRVKACTLQTGAFDAHIDNVHTGQLPRRIVVGFVSNSGFVGDYKENPYNFKHSNITSIAAYVDGVQYPTKAFTPDFSTGTFIREMNALYEAFNMDSVDSNIAINRDNYSEGNTLFGFNFAPDLSNGCGAVGHLNKLKFGSLRLQIRFKAPLVTAVTAIIFCEWDKMLEIDETRTATIDLF